MGKLVVTLFAVAGVVVVATFIVLMFLGKWLPEPLEEWESATTIIRNLGLFVAAVIAIPFLVWRTLAADKQAAAARDQVGVGIEQTWVANRTLLNAQYQNATEMLGSPILAIRLGGIYQLERIAREYPAEHHVSVMKQLCSFVRHPTDVEGQPTVNEESIDLGYAFGAVNARDFAAAGTLEREVIRADIQAAIRSIAFCHTRNLSVETEETYWLDLRGAVLTGSDLSVLDLSRAPVVSDEAIRPGPPRYAYLYTDMRGAILRWANLEGTNLSQVDLSGAIGLTKNDLNKAWACPSRLPRLAQTFDRDTGKLLVWRTLTENTNE